MPTAKYAMFMKTQKFNFPSIAINMSTWKKKKNTNVTNVTFFLKFEKKIEFCRHFFLNLNKKRILKTFFLKFEKNGILKTFFLKFEKSEF